MLVIRTWLLDMVELQAVVGRMRNRLRVLRAEREWSQAELADRLGVSRQTVNALETGKYDPSLPLAFRLARTFGLKIEDIFHDDAKEVVR